MLSQPINLVYRGRRYAKHANYDVPLYPLGLGYGPPSTFLLSRYVYSRPATKNPDTL
jgi:hypothetical protein